MSLNQTIIKELTESREVLDKFLQAEENIKAIEKAAHLMADAINQNGKIFSCGNGGSQCDAMHFAEELTGRYRDNRKALPAISIADPSHMSCVSNDYGYQYIFSRYLEGLGNKGDVLLAISTSGNSANVLQAVDTAHQLGMHTIGLTGKDGGKLATSADVVITVPHFGYADRIQEIHIKIIHIWIMMIEKLCC